MEDDKANCRAAKTWGNRIEQVQQINRLSESQVNMVHQATHTHTQHWTANTPIWSSTLECCALQRDTPTVQIHTHFGPSWLHSLIYHDIEELCEIWRALRQKKLLLVHVFTFTYDLNTWSILCSREKARTLDQNPNMLVRWISIMCIDDRIDGVEIA